MSKHRILRSSLAVLVTALPLLAGCLFSPPEKPPPPEPPIEYDPYTSPDNLVANFIKAWEGRDHPEYRDNILYNGEVEATDGSTYVPFFFYYAEGVDNWGNELPELQTYEEEEDNARRLFSGNPGRNGTPGVNSIDLLLEKINDWNVPTDPSKVEGDFYPPGTLGARYSTDMEMLLKGELPDSPGINGFQVNGFLQFWVIPVTVGEGDDAHTEYRLWKWRDLDQG